jgi:RNA polymerase sigma-70 factor (ECF subfamily)
MNANTKDAKEAKESKNAKLAKEAKPVESVSYAGSARSATDEENAQEAAFEAAFQENWARVVGVLRGLLGAEAEAEDLALETFYRLHRRPPSLESTGSLRGWLYKVATHLGLNALRARNRRRRYEEQAGILDLQEAPSVDPAQEVERRQERGRVRQVLAGMKPRSAQLLLLRHSGCSYAEMASALRIAPGSVGTLLARAELEFEKRYGEIAE